MERNPRVNDAAVGPVARSIERFGFDDLGGLSAAVRARALELAEDPRYRIVLCGYEEEHGPHMPASWRKIAWKARGAYQRRATAGTGRAEANRHRERLWLSPV